MAVLDPLKVIIDNYPEDEEENWRRLIIPYDQENSATGKFLSHVNSILSGRFHGRPAQKFYRLAPGREVRLMNAYYITCTEVVKNEAGEVVELHATYDPESRGGMSPDRRKVRGTMHWVSARHALDAELRLYDYLFEKPNPYEVPEGGEFTDNINPEFAEGREGRKAGTQPGGRRGGRTLPVHAPGLFLVDLGDFTTRCAGFQPHHLAGGYLGEMQKQRK